MIRIANMNKDKFAAREFTVETALQIDASKHEWSNYFLCGYRGVIEATSFKPTVGFDALVHGTVPIVRSPPQVSSTLC